MPIYGVLKSLPFLNSAKKRTEIQKEYTSTPDSEKKALIVEIINRISFSQLSKNTF